MGPGAGVSSYCSSQIGTCSLGGKDTHGLCAFTARASCLYHRVIAHSLELAGGSSFSIVPQPSDICLELPCRPNRDVQSSHEDCPEKMLEVYLG